VDINRNSSTAQVITLITEITSLVVGCNPMAARCLASCQKQHSTSQPL
jgi:hypothetical protein